MKKYILMCLCLATGAGFATAETMKFVTLLSQPIGTFASVEVADSTTPAKMGTLEFCNNGISGGKIDVSGVSINKMSTLGPSKLSKSDGGTVTVTGTNNKLTMAPNTAATFEGGALQADKASVAKIDVKGNLNFPQEEPNNSPIQTQTADFKAMTITNTAVYADGSGNNYTTSWQTVKPSDCKTNKHGTDAACNAELVYYKTGESSNPSGGKWAYKNYSGGGAISCSGAPSVCYNDPPSCVIGNACSPIGATCTTCTYDEAGMDDWYDSCYMSSSVLECK